MQIKQAVDVDAGAMAAVLAPILADWRSARPSSPDHILAHYIRHPDRVSCAVARIDAQVIGFQSLKRAAPGNPYGLPAGWGIIGTYVARKAAGQGVGRALFEVSRPAARRDGLLFLDATIGSGNAEGRAYYEALGFRSYRTSGLALCKRFDLTAP